MLRLQPKSNNTRHRPQNESLLLSRSEKTKNFFNTVSKYGVLFHSNHLSIKTLNDKTKEYESHIIISKKVSPSAVSRNKIKRRVKALFKEISPKSKKVIFYGKKGISNLSFKELQEEVKYLIKKSEL